MHADLERRYDTYNWTSTRQDRYRQGDIVQTNFAGGDFARGVWEWGPNVDKADANLATIVDPDQAFTLSGQGSGTGTGCWIRQTDNQTTLVDWIFSGAGTFDMGAGISYLIDKGILNIGGRSGQRWDIFTPISWGLMEGTFLEQRLRLYFKDIDFNNRSAAGGMFSFDSLKNGIIELGVINQLSTAGHVFDKVGVVTRSRISAEHFAMTNGPTDKSFWYGREAFDGAGIGPLDGGSDSRTGERTNAYKVDFRIEHISNNDPDTVRAPVIDHATYDISWRNNSVFMSFGYGGNSSPLILQRCYQDQGASAINNKYEIHLGEEAAGGLVHLYGEIGSTIDVVSYDMHLLPGALVATNDAIKLGKITAAESGESGDGTPCRNIRVKYYRPNGTAKLLPYYDVNLEDADDTILEVYGHNTNQALQRINANGKSAVLFDDRFVQVDNADPENFRVLSQPLYNEFTNLTVAAGEITIPDANTQPVISHRVNNPAAGTVENLTKINGGIAGQTLYLRTNTDARDVNIVHNGADITTSTGADVLMDSTDVLVHLWCEAPGVWIQPQ